MCQRSPIAIKFSNLLQTNPQSCLYGADFTSVPHLQHGNTLFEKMRRKSVNLGSIRSKKPIQTFSPDQQKQQIKSFVQKSKINRILLYTSFQNQKQKSPIKKKKMYVVRKKQNQKNKQEQKQKSKKQRKQYSQVFESKEKVKKIQPVILQMNQQSTISQRSRTQPIQPQKAKQKFKIKRKVPKFGIEDIPCKFNMNKNNQSCQRTAGLFISTSSNNFYNSTFYMNSKMKELQQAKFEEKYRFNEFAPSIRGIMPHPLNNEPMLERKKQIKQFYTTNVTGFSFVRSKTQQFEPNYLCAWEKQQNQYNEVIDID